MATVLCLTGGLSSSAVHVQQLGFRSELTKRRPRGARALRVVSLTRHATSALLTLRTSGGSVVTTPGHPFGSVVRGWVPAKKLSAGDALITADPGRAVNVLSSEETFTGSPTLVFNLTIQGAHAYFVGSSGLLVHNTCGRGRDLGLSPSGWSSDEEDTPGARRQNDASQRLAELEALRSETSLTPDERQKLERDIARARWELKRAQLKRDHVEAVLTAREYWEARTQAFSQTMFRRWTGAEDRRRRRMDNEQMPRWVDEQRRQHEADLDAKIALARGTAAHESEGVARALSRLADVPPGNLEERAARERDLTAAIGESISANEAVDTLRRDVFDDEIQLYLIDDMVQRDLRPVLYYLNRHLDAFKDAYDEAASALEAQMHRLETLPGGNDKLMATLQSETDRLIAARRTQLGRDIDELIRDVEHGKRAGATSNKGWGILEDTIRHLKFELSLLG